MSKQRTGSSKETVYSSLSNAEFVISNRDLVVVLIRGGSEGLQIGLRYGWVDKGSFGGGGIQSEGLVIVGSRGLEKQCGQILANNR